MSTIGELLIRLGVNNTALKAGFAESTAASGAFASKMEADSARSSAALHGIGLAAIGVSAGIVAFGVEAVRQASTFQSSMEQIRTQAGGTQAEVTAMSGAIMGLAPQVGTGPEALATALYHIESAGIRGAKALDVVKLAAEGAKVGHANLESVTNALIAATKSGISGFTGMSGAMGILNSVVGAGNMRMQDLTDSLSSGILATAKAVGVSLQSVGGAIADMTNQGVPAIDASTRLRMTLSLMEAPTSKAAKALASIGIGGSQLANDLRKPGGILTAVQDLAKHLGVVGPLSTAQTQILMHAFGGGRSSAAILTLVGDVGKLNATTSQVAKGAGAFASAWAATEATTANQADKIKASFDTITLAIGTALLPAVNSILGAVAPVVTALAQWAVANPHLAVQILAVAAGVAALAAAAIFLGPILGAIGAVLGIITSPILLVVGAILGLAAHFGLLGKGAKDAFDGIIATVQGAIPGIVSTLEGLAQKFIDWIGPMVGPALAALGDFAGSIIGWIGAQLPIWAGQLLAWAQAFVGWIAPMIPPAIGALAQFAGQILGWVVAQIPGWVTQLAKWAVAFVGWVLPMIPLVLGKLAQFALSVLGWLIGQIPALEAALNRWANAAIAWVANSIPGLLGALGNWLTQVLQWVSGVLGTIYNAFLRFGGQIAKGIIDGIGNIAKAVGDKLNTIPGVSIVGGVVAFGGSVVSNTIGGAAQLGSNVVNTVTGGGKAAPAAGLREYQTGGIVPGTGAQLAIVHGGETVIPPLTSLHLQPSSGIAAAAATASAAAVPSAAVTAAKTLASHIKLQSAIDAVTNAHTALARIVEEHVTKTRTAIDIATAVAASEKRLGLAQEKLVLLREQQALPATTASKSTGTSTSNATLTAALAAFTAALLRAVGSGVPLTLDGQTVGDILDQAQYMTATRVSSGFSG
jgi:TP901 family phage tail tape measure protein